SHYGVEWIVRFGGVPRLDPMGSRRLDRHRRNVTKRPLTKPRLQVLLHNVAMILLRRPFVLRRKHVDLPLFRERAKRHAGSCWAVASAGLGHFPPEDSTPWGVFIRSA